MTKFQTQLAPPLNCQPVKPGFAPPRLLVQRADRRDDRRRIGRESEAALRGVDVDENVSLRRCACEVTRDDTTPPMLRKQRHAQRISTN